MKIVAIALVVFAVVVSILGNTGSHMSQVQITKEYNFSADLVWSQWADIGKISDFHPDLVSSPIIGDKTHGLGSQRKVTTSDDKELLHEIIEYDEALKKLAFTFKADFLPIKDGRCFIRVKSVGSDQSTVDFRVTMVPKFGYLGSLLGKLVLEPKLTAGGHNLLDGLEDYLKSQQ